MLWCVNTDLIGISEKFKYQISNMLIAEPDIEKM